MASHTSSAPTVPKPTYVANARAATSAVAVVVAPADGSAGSPAGVPAGADGRSPGWACRCSTSVPVTWLASSRNSGALRPPSSARS
ncbi:Uncharacterised protein [Mycobacteroides abscessus]|nr:Uncharacterised protein [Mycobacteroides abscessus]